MSKETMKAITVYGPRDTHMEIVPKPEATGDMVVAKVCRTGVCATDLSIYTCAIGMVAVWLAKYYGAGKVILVGGSDDKLAAGLQIGADHVITGRDDVIQINHGTVKAGCALGGGVHEEDEIYYILSGKGKLQLDDNTVDVEGGQVLFIPEGCFHALDNSMSDEDMCILTFWRDWRYNDAYETRVKLWGKSFKTIDKD